MQLWMILGAFSAALILCDGQSQLLFTTRNDVSVVDVNSSVTSSSSSNGTSSSIRVIISGLDDVVAVDYLWAESSVYWTDISRARIYQLYVNESARSQVEVVSAGVVSPDGLACDWVGRKLYWADSETDRIEVANLNGSLRRVLYWSELDQPRAIALDPARGYMYWADWGDRPKIERAAMDGNESYRRVIVAGGDIFWPNGLTIDYAEGRIYWTDVKLKYIHSCRVDGTDRRPVVRGTLAHPVTLTLTSSSVYWSDWQTHAIYASAKSNGSAAVDGPVRVVATSVHMSTDIRAYGSERQPHVDNPCSLNNGGCSHLCLLSPSAQRYSCSCPTGILLLPDNMTCADGPEQMLLVARRTDLRVISLDTPDNTDVVLNIHGIRHAIAIDFDPVERTVYWTDDEARAIRRAHLDGSGAEFVVNVEIDHPDGIAVDWIARNLYWIDKGTDRIEMSRLNGSSRCIIISEGLQEPRAIVLDPLEGRMYWTDWGQEAKIESASLDGTDRHVVINSSLVWPNGLAIDRIKRRLYWADAELDRIEMANFDGSDRRILVSENVPHVFGFTLLGDYIYWTDWHRRTIEKAHKLTGKQRAIIVDQIADVMGLTAVNLTASDSVNSCSESNGGCSHLCIHKPSAGHPVCLCPRGMYLQADSKQCAVPEAVLIYTRRADIRRLTIGASAYVGTSEVPVIVTGVQEAWAIDCHVADSRMYWTDISTKLISSALINGTSVRQVVQFGLSQPEGIAVDWIANNLYWSDFGTGRIEMSRLNGSSRLIIVWHDVKPRAIALDPAQGYMYWSNGISSGPRLESAALDGTERQTLVSGVGQVSSLTIDYSQRKLYWANIDGPCIESFDLSSKTRQKLLTSLQQPYGIAQYGGNIYWSDWKSRAIETADKETGLLRSVVIGRQDFPMDITIHHVSRQLGWNQCSVSNGGCTHLCIAHRQFMGHHCACPTHYTLSSDNRTCLAPSSFLLISQQSVISRLPVSGTSDEIGVDIALPMTSLRSVRAVAYDINANYIYWIDAHRGSIRRSRDDGTDISILVPSDAHRDRTVQPHDIALLNHGSANSQLYWSDAKHNTINVMRLDGSNARIVINGSRQQKPRAIAVDACLGLLFWTNVGRSQRIECSALDGSSHRILFNTGIWSLGALTVDTESRRVFWIDVEHRRIESGDYSGTNRYTVADIRLDEPVGLAVHGLYLYWVDRESNTIERANKQTGTDRAVIKARLTHLTDVIVVERSKRPQVACTESCTSKRCSHQCDITSDGKAVCACPAGYKLGSNGRTCIQIDVVCASDELRCVGLRGSIICVPANLRCNHVADCVDHDDELNCSACKGPQYFTCKTVHECIFYNLSCNGRPDCLDGSDEHEANCLPCGGKPCDGKPGCAGSHDDENCSPHVGERTDNHQPSHLSIVIGSLFGLLVIIAVIVIYVCWHRRNVSRCTSHVIDKTSGIGSTKIPKLQPVMKAVTSHEIGLQHSPLMFYDHVTGTSSSSSSAAASTVCYPLNPPPSPITTSYSVVSSRHTPRHPSLMSPCSTDVCDESALHWNDCMTELGYETEPLYPPPPTPCSRYDEHGYLSRGVSVTLTDHSCDCQQHRHGVKHAVSPSSSVL